jgi:predicted neutral ceramidase superfamily lipid hydrolase
MLNSIALKYYRMMKIPATISKNYRILYPLLFLLIIIADAYPMLILHHSSLQELFRVALLHFVTILLLLLILKVATRYMRFRQIANTVLFIIAPGIPLEFISSPLKMYGIMYAAMPIIGTIALSNFMGFSKGMACIVILSFALQLLFTFALKIASPLFIALRIGVVVLLLLTSFAFVSSLKKFSSINVFKISNSWIKFMFTGNGAELEEVLNSIGEERELSIKTMLFTRDNDNIALIVPAVHFGPYRTLGSTYFPYALEHALKTYSIKAFVFHGAGSHELNLTKKDYNEFLVKEIVQRLVEFKANQVNSTEQLYEPFRVYNQMREALCLHTEYISFLIVSSPVVGGDDLPQELQLEAEKIANTYGFKDAAVIDAHNVEGERELRLDVFTPLLKAAFSERGPVCEELRVGYGEDDILEHVKGICTRKVKVLTIECNKNLYTLIYLYGNNAKPGVRETLRKIAIMRGFKDAELVTPDDHTCAGMVFDTPYYSIELNEALIKSVDRALTKSFQDLKPAKVRVQSYKFRVRVMSNRIFELLETATKVGSAILKYLKVVIPILYIAWIIITVLTSVFAM